jgi:hypothetical protein
VTIKVKEREDGSFDIEWDENDPVESMMNTWTESDFIDTISKYLDELKQNDINGKGEDLS